MRIAQIAPLYESVPPKLYGGTERVVSYLTEELVRQGHDVTLFASGDSVTGARLVACSPRALRLDETWIDPLAYNVVMVDKVFKAAHKFDIIHFHTDYLHFPLSKRYGVPTIMTMHGRLDVPEMVPVFRQFPHMRLVSISDAQREPLPWADWQGTVHHGLPKDLYTFKEAPGDYLAFLGRISPEKRPDRAIEIAKRTGMKLKMAAKVDKVDAEYFKQQIEPLLNDPLVEFIGEINEKEKDEFLGNAYALLFPIDWPEPFGMVMIEAMACGTPVVAFPGGSVPEVIQDGVNGFISSDLDQAVEAVQRVSTLSRLECRQVFEERFSAERMAKDYVAIFEHVTRAAALDQNVPIVPLELTQPAGRGVIAPASGLHNWESALEG
jgi:glycosyltransferase involved in cell wall biosynthesis